MTRGSQIHDEVSDHFKECAQCRAVDPERVRVQRPVVLSRSEVCNLIKVLDEFSRGTASVSYSLPLAELHALRARLASFQNQAVPDATLSALCPTGRSIYKAYLRWLAEPDE